jgi:murein L,D-transpeptidase YafK
MKYFLYVLLSISIFILVYIFIPYSPIPNDVSIEKIVVDKSERKLMVYCNGSIVKTFSISLGDSPIGHKKRKGDEKTPEGDYVIDSKAGLGASGYHKNLGVSYPNKKDLVNARKKGFSPGGYIKIHGLKNGQGFFGRIQRWRDWTDGCMAVTNDEMDDLYKHVKIGTPITIVP